MLEEKILEAVKCKDKWNQLEQLLEDIKQQYDIQNFSLNDYCINDIDGVIEKQIDWLKDELLKEHNDERAINILEQWNEHYIDGGYDYKTIHNLEELLANLYDDGQVFYIEVDNEIIFLPMIEYGVGQDKVTLTFSECNQIMKDTKMNLSIPVVYDYRTHDDPYNITIDYKEDSINLFDLDVTMEDIINFNDIEERVMVLMQEYERD